MAKATRNVPKKDAEPPQMLSPRSSKKPSKQPDPIFESIQERKEYGSYLSVIKGKDKPKGPSSDVFEFNLTLTGKGIPSNHLQTDTA